VTPTRTRRIGLLLFGLLSIGDLSTLALTDGNTPPYPVAALDAVLGLSSLVLVVLAWRGRPRTLVPLVVLRVVSALTALPAFFIGEAPAPAVGAAAVIVVLTAVGVLLVGRRPVQVTSA
jgi:hypothetical protein